MRAVLEHAPRFSAGGPCAGHLDSMPTLSSLLVQREIATMGAVDDGISRQVLHGGDLPTNLLELGVVGEEALARALGESLGLQPAPTGRLPAPGETARSMVPGELAVRHGIFPLAVEGSTLVVATSESISPAVEEDLSSALDMSLRALAAPLVRIREALGTYYGVPIDRRFARLLAKLDGSRDPSPSSRPPPAPATIRSSFPGPAPGVPGPFGASAAPLSPPSAPEPAGDPPAGEPEPGARRRRTTAFGLGLELPTELAAPLQPAAPSRPPAAFPSSPPARYPLTAASPSGPSVPTQPGLAGFLRRVASEHKTPRSARQRRKGPFSAPMAERELEQATSTEAALDVFFDFAHQFFEYSALFVVRADLAVGCEAAGPGADRAQVASMGVRLDLPSAFAAARDRRGPLVAPLSSTGLDAELARDLGRVATLGASVAVLPVVLRARMVAILYGDDGANGVELSALGELVAFAALTAAALERVILLKKRGSARHSESVPPGPPPARQAGMPAARTGAAVLARAFGAADGSAPPPRHEVGAESPSTLAARPPQRPSVPPPHAADDLDGGWPVSTRRPVETSTGPEVPRASHGDASAPSAAARSVPVDVAALRAKATIPGHRFAMEGLVGNRGPAPAHEAPSDAGPADFAVRFAGFLGGGPDGEALLRELASNPVRALPFIDAAFPGPLTVDRHRVRDQLPLASRCGPLLELIAALGPTALPILAGRCDDSDPELRFWAAHALAELPLAAAAVALFPRLFDEDVSVRRIARRSAGALLRESDSGPPLVAALERFSGDAAESGSRRVLAIDAMGEMRSGALVPGLMAVLTDADDEVSGAARRALSLVTRQDFGRDSQRWGEWWAANASRHRVEWLIDALMHELPSMRRAAGDELKHLTKEYFGYYDDLPKKERERAHGRYRDWWEREGKTRFKN